MKRSGKKRKRVPSRDPRLEGLRLLVVDEDIWMGRSVAIFCQMQGATVDLATSTEAARAALQDEPLPYDVILAGAGVCNIAIEEVMVDLRRRHADIAVVIHASAAATAESFSPFGALLEGIADVRPVPAPIQNYAHAAVEAHRGGHTIRRILATRTIPPAFPAAHVPAVYPAPKYGRVVVNFADAAAAVRSQDPEFSQRGTRP